MRYNPQLQFDLWYLVDQVNTGWYRSAPSLANRVSKYRAPKVYHKNQEERSEKTVWTYWTTWNPIFSLRAFYFNNFVMWTIELEHINDRTRVVALSTLYRSNFRIPYSQNVIVFCYLPIKSICFSSKSILSLNHAIDFE